LAQGVFVPGFRAPFFTFSGLVARVCATKMAPKSNLSFDYSKWDRLEISDDEDTHHPNLDKNLNIRVNRMTRDRKEEEIDTEQKKLLEAGKTDEAEKLDKKRPLHVGNLSHVADERTIINRIDGTVKDRTVKDGESFSVDDYSMFKQDHKKLLDEFTNADWEKSHSMLKEQGHILMDENANNYFLLTCLEEEMKGNSSTVMKMARQGQMISQIFQLAAPMNRPPRDLVPRFFERFENDNAQEAFQEGVDHFLKHIKARAVQKKKEEEDEETKAKEEAAAAAARGDAAGGDCAEMEEEEEEERQVVSLVDAMRDMSKEERMGPAGLDPVEVFDSLPEVLQQCFSTGDVEKLKKVATEMEPAVFEEHFKRCIDSGLWKSG